ncbi:HAD-IIB family hydrolase [Thiohalophilus sp.]|uniref:HAD-IIB family hydrolase n=1 Tax=Thiohalophilus sp. TaxID=3028392 RepID=UPI002ACE02A1|nr:HAD-IIB family hydrolase [Thiohalophilus sp.]MDZ7804606.1 HAD-IIB family hydrolase [Thiohalophilus sp.]
MTERVLICTDLDRTLIPNGHPSESTLARPLLRRLVERDEVYLAYVSGRDKVLLNEAIREWDLPLPDYAIGDVGTTLYTINGGHWQLMSSWQEEISRDWGDYQRTDIADWLQDIDALTLQEAHKQNDYKLSYYAPVDISVETLLRDIRQRLDARHLRYNLIWSIDDLKQIGLLDILPQRANKLEAIRFLMQSQAFPVDTTVFSGDSGNDLEVLTSEIQATLVNNASEAIKQQATEMAEQNGYVNRLYIARGDFLDMNGNYAAGILEGLAHYIPHTRKWMTETETSRDGGS